MYVIDYWSGLRDDDMWITRNWVFGVNHPIWSQPSHRCNSIKLRRMRLVLHHEEHFEDVIISIIAFFASLDLPLIPFDMIAFRRSLTEETHAFHMFQKHVNHMWSMWNECDNIQTTCKATRDNMKWHLKTCDYMQSFPKPGFHMISRVKFHVKSCGFFSVRGVSIVLESDLKGGRIDWYSPTRELWSAFDTSGCSSYLNSYTLL